MLSKYVKFYVKIPSYFIESGKKVLWATFCHTVYNHCALFSDLCRIMSDLFSGNTNK